MAESIFGSHEAALKMQTLRGQLLANNLANADTPGFKARDIDFKAALSQESDFMKRSATREMATTDSRHFGGMAVTTTNDFLKYRMPTQPSLDGNTVETHIEKAKFMENAMQQQATLEFINSKITGIRGALRGE